MLTGKIADIDYEEEVVCTEIDYDHHIVSLHIDCCKGFIPTVGSLVEISDSSSAEWFIRERKITRNRR